jgi:tyrosyl-tRNA synthetase
MTKQGAVKIDGEKIMDEKIEIVPIEGMIVQVGKRKFAKIK